MPTTLPRSHYLDKGICPGCKCRSLEPTRTACSVCIAAKKNWENNNRVRMAINNKKRYEDLKSKGLCVCCTLPTGGNVYCRTCTNKIVRHKTFYRPLHSRNRWSKR